MIRSSMLVVAVAATLIACGKSVEGLPFPQSQLDAAIESCMSKYAELTGKDSLKEFNEINTVYAWVVHQEKFFLTFIPSGYGHFGEPIADDFRLYLGCGGSLSKGGVDSVLVHHSQFESSWLMKANEESGEEFFEQVTTEAWYQQKGDSFAFVASQNFEEGGFLRR